MALAPISRPGMRDGNTDPRELFLDTFTGEVMTKFKQVCVFSDKHFVRTIEHGRAARFDAIGGVEAKYHNPGANVIDDAQTVKHNSFDITVDGLLLASVMLYDLDEVMNHYDVRSRYSDQIACALANQYDVNIARTGLLAARSAARIPEGDGGAAVTQALFATDPIALTKGLYQAAEILDSKNVSAVGRYFFCRPAVFYRLHQNLNLINSQFNGAGSISEGDLLRVVGFHVVKTNSLPNTNVTGTYKNKYDGDFSKTVGLCMNTDAVGTVKLKDLSAECEWKIEYQSHLCLAKYALGHGVLRPECAVELATA